MKKTTINYIIDIIIGFGFIISAVTGIILLFNESGGYKGGRNPQYAVHAMWISIHTWNTIIMSVGVAAHLILHWNWIVCMTKKLLLSKNNDIQMVHNLKPACKVITE